MPKGVKSSYTDKQKRKAEHIEKSYEKRGVSKKTAKSRAWATVNKSSGGGKEERLRPGQERKQESQPKRRPQGRKSHGETEKLQVTSVGAFTGP